MRFMLTAFMSLCLTGLAAAAQDVTVYEPPSSAIASLRSAIVSAEVTEDEGAYTIDFSVKPGDASSASIGDFIPSITLLPGPTTPPAGD